jgi:phospholipid/cholesterol/gamma-HCH transport system substrate-binding protein
MNKGISTNAKVGIFVALVLVLLFWITFKISSGTIFGRLKGYTLTAIFDNAQGLNTKTRVYLAGIQIGYVEDIKLHDDKALVVLRIMPDIQIEENAKAVIRTKGLLGEKYIEIVPGNEQAAVIPPGGQITFTESPPDFEELMNKLNSIASDVKSVTQSLNEVFGGSKGTRNIKEMVDNLNKTIIHMDLLITSTNANLNKTFDSFNTFAQALKEQGPDILTNLAQISEELHSIIAENKQSVNETIENINRVSKELDKTLANLEVITNNLKQGKGTIGKLLTDKKTEEQVTKAISGLSTMVGGTSRFRTIVSYRGEYQFLYHNIKSYLDLRLQPTWDKYLLLGVVDDPGGYSSTSTTYTTVKDVNTGTVQQTQTITNHISDQLKLNAELAKRISYFTFRGGIIESTGGIGVDIDTPNDEAQLSVEMFNFNKQPYPEIKTMLSISILRYFLLSGGITDIANRDSRTWFLGVGLRFDDEDLKNVFGLAASTTYVNTK